MGCSDMRSLNFDGFIKIVEFMEFCSLYMLSKIDKLKLN